MTFLLWNTIDVERFVGLNIHGFSPIKALQKYFCVVFTRSALYLVQLKRDTYIHRKTFVVLLKTVKMLNFCPANISMLMVVS